MGIDRSGFLFAVALGLLAHGLIGYVPFPFGDDFAYGPLTEIRDNPALYPRDDQLRLFQNHALIYEWLYHLGGSGPGIEPAFRIAIWIQAAAACVALLMVLRALNAPLAVLPVVLALGVVVRLDGVGRGDFGGLISPFFHHHNVALALVLGAVAAGLFRKSWLAGLLLGVAVYAQPMTAFHGALIAGFGALLRNPSEAFKMAVASIVVALPAAIPILNFMLGEPDSTVSLDLVQDAYRFRAPLHYDPTWLDIGLATLYVFAGWAGVALLARIDAPVARFSAGVMIGFSVLHLVTIIVYKAGFAEWVGFYILDANRSTPALFVLGPAFALAGMCRAHRGSVFWITGILLVAIAALNSTMAGIGLIAFGAVMFVLGDTPRGRAGLLIGLMAGLVVIFPAAPSPPPLPEPTRDAFGRIRAETPPDALFVIPVNLFEFRHYTQRSAYVDFKLFSVAQPNQAALTRARLEEVAQPSPSHRTEQGWHAARLWDEDQHKAATCSKMAEMLNITGADYYLRRISEDEIPPDCPAMPSPIRTETLVLYGPSG